VRRVIKYLLIPALVAVLIASATYFVTLPVAGYTVSGFPAPYVRFYPCCSGGGTGGASGDPSYFYDNTYLFNTLNFVADVVVWMAISLVVAATLTVRRLAIAAIAGLGITSLTLLLSPLASITPFGGAETALTPLGFPYEFVTYYTGGLLGFSYSGYYFTLSAAIADYALWTGVMLVVTGVALTIIQRTHYYLHIKQVLRL
jgi:hypothetical protein